jgi:hypothetical protein
MMNRDICNNNESYEIYKKVGSNNSKKIVKTLIKVREKYETKLSMALLSPKDNQFQIKKFKKILKKLDETIKARLFEVSLK